MSRVQRTLVRLYPRPFRDRFGTEIDQVLRRSSGRGVNSDLARGAITEQWRETMSTDAASLSSHPVAAGLFVLAVAGTLGGLLLTIAWVGFAPMAILPAAIAWTSGKRAGILRPAGSAPRARRSASAVLLGVIALAIVLSSTMWFGFGRG